jgi:hypothetical protein
MRLLLDAGLQIEREYMLLFSIQIFKTRSDRLAALSFYGRGPELECRRIRIKNSDIPTSSVSAPDFFSQRYSQTSTSVPTHDKELFHVPYFGVVGNK